MKKINLRAKYSALQIELPVRFIDEKMVHAVVLTYPRCDGIVINKADDAERVDKALSLAKQFTVPVAITAWQTEHPIKLYWRQLS